MRNFGIVLFVVAVFCTGSSFAQERSSKNVVRKSQLIRKQYVPSEDMVSLNVIESEFKIKRGHQCFYSGLVHSSVGNEVEVWSEGDGLELVKTHFNYDNADNAGLKGGDKGTKYFIFDGIKKGEYTVIVKESFRGDVKRTYKIKVIVD